MTRAAVHQIVRHAIAVTGFRDLTKHTVTLREEQIDQAAERIIDDLAGLALEQRARRDGEPQQTPERLRPHLVTQETSHADR